MATSCAYEFQLKHFGFTDCSPENLYESQWGKSRLAYLVYRVIAFCYAISWIIADVVVIPQPYYAIFLTNWTEVAGCLYFFLAMCVVVYGFIIKTNHGQELRWFHKVVWIVYSAALAASLMTDLLFWGLLSQDLPTHALVSPFNIHEHAINYLMLVIDLFVNKVPIRLLHFIYGIGYGLTYTVFTLILYGAGVTSAVYPPLDWKNAPGTAALYALGASFIAAPAAHAIHFGFYHLRDCLARTCTPDSEVTNDQTIDHMEMGGTDNLGYQQ